jgi:hypothetical protein
MSRFCGPDARDPLGGSSQFKYYPYLLALSNPKKTLGRGRFPPLRLPLGHRSAARTKSQSGDFVVAGGGVSEIEALLSSLPGSWSLWVRRCYMPRSLLAVG